MEMYNFIEATSIVGLRNNVMIVSFCLKRLGSEIFCVESYMYVSVDWHDWDLDHKTLD